MTLRHMILVCREFHKIHIDFYRLLIYIIVQRNFSHELHEFLKHFHFVLICAIRGKNYQPLIFTDY